ncbi:MAG: isoaspartyl peptidase/L-asparaginase [Ignavibacteriales bacterium]|nr:isoaspartyl peptidase/L-asparaginase [Ignavibacteriales bacterium]
MGSRFIDSNSLSKSKDQDKYTIVIHGGVGTISREMPDSIKQDYLNSLSNALTIGKNILQNGGTSLDAVEKVVKLFENDDSRFNAGKGAVLYFGR